MITETWDNFPDTNNWQKFVAIMQEMFRDGTMDGECMWKTVTLIPKGKRKFWGIGLVEVLWKYFVRLLNRRITSAIKYHDVLHKFSAGCGMGITTLEAKLLQKLTAMREKFLFEVFLDLHNSYNALEQDR